MPPPTLDNLFDPNSVYFNGALRLPTPPGAKSTFTDALNPATINGGELQGNTTVVDGYLKSQNYVAGASGWYLDPTTGEFNFAVSVDSLDIPDTTTANSFHVNTAGDTWWGATTFAAALASISKAGAAIFSSIAITGGSVSGASITAIPNS